MVHTRFCVFLKRFGQDSFLSGTMAPQSVAARRRAAAAEARAADKAKLTPTCLPLAEDICCVGGPVDDRPSAEEPIVLEREVCPAGKHQGKTFLEVLEDRPFCLWIVKEPRRGWMGLLKTFLETEHGFEQPPPETAPEMDPEEAAEAAKVAAARAKLFAKGGGKGQSKKVVPPVVQASPVTTFRVPFQPTTEWQELLPEHVCPAGLQFRMDMASGKNYARFANL